MGGSRAWCWRTPTGSMVRPLPVPYPEFRTHTDDFGAQRVMLTHMSWDMLAHVHAVLEECTEDGLVGEL